MIVRMIECDSCARWDRVVEGRPSPGTLRDRGWRLWQSGRAGWRHLCPECVRVLEGSRRSGDGAAPRQAQGPRSLSAGKVDTELARMVAEGEGWVFDAQDHLRTADGRPVARSIELAAAAMRAQGWFAADGSVRWDQVEAVGSVETCVRRAAYALEAL
ncbi:hypothetical protein ACIG47_09395 [Promicromonospora sp. NPDC052451]|uniref:hypothetical protein n=1 Tax=Promicromonospora sp. NPDC052451 TaxID=3364407 RepID=UPI0037CC7919